MSTAEKRQYSVQEYLAFERASETKHEYYQGENFAMTGASFAHNRLVSNLLGLFRNGLLTTNCQALASDMRVKVDATGLYTYPDVTVICDKPQFEDAVFDTLLNPKLIVEVLSESTEAYDRGEKFAHYQRMDSLEEYVMVSQKECRVETFKREADSEWLFSYVTGREARVHFRSIDMMLELHEIYFQVEIP